MLKARHLSIHGSQEIKHPMLLISQDYKVNLTFFSSKSKQTRTVPNLTIIAYKGRKSKIRRSKTESKKIMIDSYKISQILKISTTTFFKN